MSARDQKNKGGRAVDVEYQILYNGVNTVASGHHAFSVVIRLMSRADFKFMTVEKVEVEK